MARWSGRGIPPTRKKLHRWRAVQEKARLAGQAGGKGEASHRDQTWNKRTRGSIINPERFERLWT